MKVPMDKMLELSVEEEFRDREARFPNYSPRSIVALILGDFEKAGFASRYLRSDNKIGWRATQKLREDLFERCQEAIDEQEDS